MSNDNLFNDLPKMQGCMSGAPKEQTVIPDSFPITKCKPSRRGIKAGYTIKPRKSGKPLSWSVAEALAPAADKTYEELEEEAEVTSVRSLSRQEAEMIEEIERLKKENDRLKSK